MYLILTKSVAVASAASALGSSLPICHLALLSGLGFHALFPTLLEGIHRLVKQARCFPSMSRSLGLRLARWEQSSFHANVCVAEPHPVWGTPEHFLVAIPLLRLAFVWGLGCMLGSKLPIAAATARPPPLLRRHMSSRLATRPTTSDVVERGRSKQLSPPVRLLGKSLFSQRPRKKACKRFWTSRWLLYAPPIATHMAGPSSSLAHCSGVRSGTDAAAPAGRPCGGVRDLTRAPLLPDVSSFSFDTSTAFWSAPKISDSMLLAAMFGCSAVSASRTSASGFAVSPWASSLSAFVKRIVPLLFCAHVPFRARASTFRAAAGFSFKLSKW